MGKHKILSRPLTESEGFAHIENYYRSGLRSVEYFRDHEISEWQFYKWRRRYLAVHSEIDPGRASQKSAKAKTQKRFHPVRIESTSGIRISGLEIYYPHGVRLVVGNDQSIGIETLSELIKLRV
jgi:transposase-like protein